MVLGRSRANEILTETRDKDPFDFPVVCQDHPQLWHPTEPPALLQIIPSYNFYYSWIFSSTLTHVLLTKKKS